MIGRDGVGSGSGVEVRKILFLTTHGGEKE